LSGAAGSLRFLFKGEERFAGVSRRTKWSSGSFRATNARSISDGPGRITNIIRIRIIHHIWCHCCHQGKSAARLNASWTRQKTLLLPVAYDQFWPVCALV